MAIVTLWEDAAGVLRIGVDGSDPYIGFAGLESTGSTFAADAAALVAGDVAGWTVDRLDEGWEPQGDPVAEWIDGEVRWLQEPGLAARAYVGVDRNAPLVAR